MKLNIRNKLLLITVIPVIVLILVAVESAFSDYKIYKQNAYFLQQIKFINSSSELLYNTQFERGLSTISHETDNYDYFFKLLKNQRKQTTRESQLFLKQDSMYLTAISKEFLKQTQKSIAYLKALRLQLDNESVSIEDGYLFYTSFNTSLLELIDTISVYTNNEEISSLLTGLQKIQKLQELLAQERGQITKLLAQDDILEKDRYKLRTNSKDQRKESKSVKLVLDGTVFQERLNKIEKKFVGLKLNYLLLTPEQWFKKSTRKIDYIHILYKDVLTEANKLLKKEQDSLKVNFLMELIGTVFLVLFVLLINLSVSRKITKSIEKLGDGLEDFFKFLHSETFSPSSIIINSHDEIADMSQNINKEMEIIENNLHDDKDFISEVTQIVQMMKEGDFSERPYFEPKDPSLKELKTVFNELMELISGKIKEQTDSLERLNSSLEDKVYHQTLELQNQVQTVTKARDEAIQAQIAKDEFLANMSHEIRTPLNGILGFVTILKKTIKEEKPLNYLNIIADSGKSLLSIINDILDFSKIQSGQFIIDKHATNAVEEFSNTIMLFASKAYEKNLIYVVYIDPNIPEKINVDATRVKQIVSNLLSNAIKFTADNGTIKVSITYANSFLNISVGDSGIGISPQNQAKIFSAFTQADGSTTRNYGGTGLGLSISSSLAELMGGEITLESKVGKGSVFTLNVPVEVLEEVPSKLLDLDNYKELRVAILTNCVECSSHIRLIHKYLNDFGIQNTIELESYEKDGYDLLFFVPDEEYNTQIIENGIPAIALLRSETLKLADIENITSLYAPFIPRAIVEALEESGAVKNKTMIVQEEETEEEIEYEGSILIAEDNKTNQMLIKLLMMDYGIDFTLANDGVEAVDMFKSGTFDMVLMDENMPNLNGIGATHQIKAYEEEKGLKVTPIIALTASALDSDRERFIQEGLDGFVAKPIDNKMLEAELDKYLKRI